MKRRVFLMVCGVCLLASSVGLARPGIQVLTTKYDFWQTPSPADGGDTEVLVTAPAGFFGQNPLSDPVYEMVPLVGDPFGPNAGAHKPAQADTSIRRSGDPQFPPGTNYPKTAPPVTLKVYALSMVSVSPITITYNGGQNPELWDLRVGLSDYPQPAGTLTATMTYANGGTFDSVLNVMPKYTFTRVSDGATVEMDGANWGIVVDLSADDAPWTQCIILDDGTQECKFHPGVEEVAVGRSAGQPADATPNPCDGIIGGDIDAATCWQLLRILELRALDRHAVFYCMDCIDPWIRPVDVAEVSEVQEFE